MSTTDSGKLCCRRMSLITATRPDPTGLVLCGTEADDGWECDGWEWTGTVPRPVVVSVFVHWVVTGVSAMAVTDPEILWESPSFLETFWFFPESGECLELEGMHISVLSHPTIWRGRLPPRPCCLGRVKHRSVSPCFPLWRTCSSAQPWRQKENRLFEVPSGRRHSVGLGLSSRDSASAVTLRAPWRCVGTSIIANLSSSWVNSRVLWNRDRECVHPKYGRRCMSVEHALDCRTWWYNRRG